METIKALVGENDLRTNEMEAVADKILEEASALEFAALVSLALLSIKAIIH